MLTLHDAPSRRDFLTAGTSALGGLTLPSLLRASESKAAHGKSVIFIFMQGGPSQFETFDPKPDAPESIRTVTDTIRTSVPGMHFAEPMGQLARRAHHLTVVRSFRTNNAGHNIEPIVGPDTMKANLGVLVSHAAGPNTSGMPANTILYPQSVCKDVTRGSARGDLAATGAFGQAYAPFVPGTSGPAQKNLRLSLPRDRFDDRLRLLGEFDRARRAIDAEAPSEYHGRAREMLLSGSVADAFDLSKESPRVLARYDTARYAPAHGWKKSDRGKRGYYVGQAKSIGKLLLLARRLCEAGCGFVTIHADYEGVWDMHADGNNLNMIDGMQAIGLPFDHAVSAFIDDVEARGLSEKILLVCCGEMGRTPRINKNGGRDHWGRLAPLLLYGGGSRGGRVIGQSTRDGGEPASEPYGPAALVSMVLHTLFDVGRMRLVPRLAAVARLAEAAPIPLLS
jgi:hypothetical protein